MPDARQYFTTGLLFDTINPELSSDAGPFRPVPDTSRMAHRAAVNAGRIGKRSAEVLQWLIEWTAAHQDAPTSAELARTYAPHYPDQPELWVVLHVRRGLTDLRKAGHVRKGDDRHCTVTRATGNTWQIVSR